MKFTQPSQNTSVHIVPKPSTPQNMSPNVQPVAIFHVHINPFAQAVMQIRATPQKSLPPISNRRPSTAASLFTKHAQIAANATHLNPNTSVILPPQLQTSYNHYTLLAPLPSFQDTTFYDDLDGTNLPSNYQSNGFKSRPTMSTISEIVTSNTSSRRAKNRWSI